MRNARNSSGGQQRRHQQATATTTTSRGNRPASNPSPAALLNKRLVELGKKQRWQDLLEVAEQERVNFNNVNYATVICQLGHMQSFNKNKEDPRFLAFLQALATAMEERGLPWIQARSASNIIHAIGKMKLRNPSTKRILKWISNPEVAAKFVMEGAPREIANTAWACATLGFAAPSLFAEIHRQSKWLVQTGNSQDVANTAWAFAALGCQASGLLAEIERHSNWLVNNGTPQAVANTAWACAKKRFNARQLFAEIEHQSEWLVSDGDPQQVANTAWACATLGFAAPRLFAEIEHQSKWLVNNGDSQHIANTAWACATLGFAALNLFAEIDRRSEWLVKHAKPQGISNMCYAIALLGMGKSSEALLAKLWGKGIQLFATDDEFTDLDLYQLAQTRLFVAADGVKLQQTPENMTTGMEVALMTSNECVSRSSSNVSHLLHEIGFPHECEVSPDSKTSGGMLAIDFACKERKIAIEFDGPSHYLKAVKSGELTSTENGATKAKRRFLKQLGWKVINIDYRDYDQAQRASKGEQWLREKLLASGVEFS